MCIWCLCLVGKSRNKARCCARDIENERRHAILYAKAIAKRSPVSLWLPLKYLRMALSHHNHTLRSFIFELCCTYIQCSIYIHHMLFKMYVSLRITQLNAICHHTYTHLSSVQIKDKVPQREYIQVKVPQSCRMCET